MWYPFWTRILVGVAARIDQDRLSVSPQLPVWLIKKESSESLLRDLLKDSQDDYLSEISTSSSSPGRSELNDPDYQPSDGMETGDTSTWGASLSRATALQTTKPSRAPYVEVNEGEEVHIVSSAETEATISSLDFASFPEEDGSGDSDMPVSSMSTSSPGSQAESGYSGLHYSSNHGERTSVTAGSSQDVFSSSHDDIDPVDYMDTRPSYSDDGSESDITMNHPTRMAQTLTRELAGILADGAVILSGKRATRTARSSEAASVKADKRDLGGRVGSSPKHLTQQSRSEKVEPSQTILKRIADFGLIYPDREGECLVPAIAEIKRAAEFDNDSLDETLAPEPYSKDVRKLLDAAKIQATDQAHLHLSSRNGRDQESVFVLIASGDIYQWTTVRRVVNLTAEDIDFDDLDYVPPQSNFERGDWSEPKRWHDSDRSIIIPIIKQILQMSTGQDFEEEADVDCDMLD
ncbi:hypothetical protein D9613_007095 [Agrocybe pediades]|uniref:Uncharacterized protein n=1 Tax=Agrocybe pediades TaxID=84607 RepID=A0A8H4VIC4_9AGAR|nr:hypothetical protein D9613_007095 [Agrocybe pediades]KAF9565902.1 hypothetical protein CPC08DRAFT_759273 [Agrocybe pediades]